ncbi:hypothetical protein CMO91_02530 [Candidatus Woesearchaeota archaeon]|nr:hypothetical protein [Candidatus Woesearchaeota archaeon]
MKAFSLVRGSGITAEEADADLQEAYEKRCKTDSRKVVPPTERHFYRISGRVLEDKISETIPDRLESFEVSGPAGWAPLLARVEELVRGPEEKAKYHLGFGVNAQIPQDSDLGE